MKLKLDHVKYVVFDEADRLFEMGFMEQVESSCIHILKSFFTLLFCSSGIYSNVCQQTVKRFSFRRRCQKCLSTLQMPACRSPFSVRLYFIILSISAWLFNILVRLDVDTKISEKLDMQFFLCRNDDKLAALLHLLRKFVDKREQTIVFCATIRHVEYYAALLSTAGLDCVYLHSQLDPAARRHNIERLASICYSDDTSAAICRFRTNDARILLVTDVAARGVDIPLLDNAINVHFPARPKLFVHRVGRVARAGKTGAAYSLISYEELPYVIDFFLYLGQELKFCTSANTSDGKQ